MDPIHNTVFIDEAEQRLRLLRGSLLVSRQEGRSAGLDLAAEIGSLRKNAEQLNSGAIATILETIEREAVGSFGSNRALSDTEMYAILDLISHAEAEVIKLRFAQEDDTNVGDLVDASFDVFQLGSADAPEPAAKEATEEEDEFEPDAEMLEIFSMEADELLVNIETNLELLSASPADRDALWEVRRHAHTFKGAAGIIGLKKPSKLAHRIEDLLDHLAQNEIVPDTSILELITAATDCLRAITKGDTSEGTADRTAEVYRSFDSVMSRLSAGPLPEPEAPVMRVTEPVLLEPTPSLPDVARMTEAVAQRRPIVRVSIARLDNLVRIVRDLVVSRSTVEQRMSAIEVQLEALSKATRRLQTANAKIENDFEASMLGSYMPASFGRPRSYREDGGFASEGEEFDALEFDRYTDFHQSSRELSEAIQDCFTIGTSLEALKGTLDAVIDDQRRLIEETQERVMQIRLIKFESIATRLQRAVRVTCEEEHKKAEIAVENQDIELDTDVLDSLVEPLMHLIRNAVVHGIEPPDTRRLLGKPETGRITVRVANQETHIELKVSDDGRGIVGAALKERAVESGMIDPRETESSTDDLMSLLVLPGLTTAEKLTMSAGRGVGMGIVKESVEARNGTLSVETSPQQGTTFTIRVPLAFAVTQALLVRSHNHLAAVPFKVVKRILDISPTDVRRDGPAFFVETGSWKVPAFRLSDHFSPVGSTENESLSALLIETEDEHFALIVDEILRTEEVAVKPLGRPLDEIAGLLGAAILGNGEVVPVLDVSYIPKAEMPLRAEPAPEIADTRTFVLVVDDSPSVRHMTSKVVTAAGWKVQTAKDGIEALEMLNSPELPDVILTDVEMPRMDGYELAAVVKEHETLRQIPIVFITSRAGEKHKERAAELGVSEYLTKPFIESELLSTVERLAAKPVEVLI